MRYIPYAPARAAIALLLGTMMTGCASVPQALQGQFSALDPATATAADQGAHVRWGGRLLEVRPERERTCFEILSLPLAEATARPNDDATPGRRFLACREGFADPAAYPEQRLVTVTGELAGFATRTIGQYEYRYPRLQARAIHLWPQPRQRADEDYDLMPWWYDPYPRRSPYR